MDPSPSCRGARHDTATATGGDLGGQLLEAFPVGFVAVSGQPQRFADNVAGRGVAAAADTFVDELLEVGAQGGLLSEAVGVGNGRR
jgi:hypothetical protein